MSLFQAKPVLNTKPGGSILYWTIIFLNDQTPCLGCKRNETGQKAAISDYLVLVFSTIMSWKKKAARVHDVH